MPQGMTILALPARLAAANGSGAFCICARRSIVVYYQLKDALP